MGISHSETLKQIRKKTSQTKKYGIPKIPGSLLFFQTYSLLSWSEFILALKSCFGWHFRLGVNTKPKVSSFPSISSAVSLDFISYLPTALSTKTLAPRAIPSTNSSGPRIAPWKYRSTQISAAGNFWTFTELLEHNRIYPIWPLYQKLFKD